MTKRKTRKSATPPSAPKPPPFPFEIETHDGDFARHLMVQYCKGTPLVSNGRCHFRRYRVTIEEIPETQEELQARLIRMANENDLESVHSDNTEAFVRAAMSVGMERREAHDLLSAARRGRKTNEE